ncbi:type II secretion system F family protein [Frankia sp. Cppng1_Ct_nod]|uniref:type II secretion system F family protein n=1 Tax=Frankia sp. Cppng1_Ct_nod TaxID=2897162 RepID=UPI0010416CC8|nr:type II secretion system F family protein [Frankia sp. Cppng1_Ct_nod]
MLTTAFAASCCAGAAALAVGPIGRRPPAVRSTGTQQNASRPADEPTRRLRLPVTGSWMPPTLLAIATVVIGAGLGPVAAYTGIVGFWATRRALHRTSVRRRRNTQRAHAEEVLSALATELEAGLSPTEALRSAVHDVADATGQTRVRQTGRRNDTPIDEPLTLDAELAHGADPAVVLARFETPTLRQLAAAWRVSQNAGIPLAPLANRLAIVVRAEREQDGEITAALAGPRASGRLVASLPVVGIALGALLGASPLEILLGTPAGTACLAVGVTLDLAGLAWINRLTDAAQRRSPTGNDRVSTTDPSSTAGVSR